MVTQIETTKAALSFSSPTIVEKRGKKLAASWYIAMHSKLLTKKPKAIELFGRTLVAWRDKTDKPVIMERYCSHMGMGCVTAQVEYTS